MNITMKKKLIVTSLLAASVFASAANAADGTITVKGSIAATPCQIQPTSKSQNINMKLINQAMFDNVKQGEAFDTSTEPFKIELTSCPKVSQNAIVTFSGKADTDLPSAIKLGGTVAGVALKVYENDGKEVVLTGGSGAAEQQKLSTSGTNTLEYKVKYVKSSTTLVEGEADAVIDFDVTYN
ncbi:fimbrial protein [Yersinia enterocolitica]|uniref:fimbrial protein n=1 Tax=Yersinia enterocolitica TaxID=630 RepID=UPI0005DB4364|nr:fimbrial protein [Yersinia enterocolitica]CNK10095.1 putative fimbrial protein [Yersinia enterocolitica]HDL8466097.1 type 1 fimbrial protein [Yersinia enterocolitica]HDL8471329.1 type 1 fimbrial protein [Yersinia enterocolitica]HDL8491672.1 type 1 fimbrial protein [Yersinia enterocolitica]HDO7714561.1 type 1 fimbrial protein [Yersinia enterocolitica]